jgi:hypothetical protein
MSDEHKARLERVDKNGPIPAHRPELGPCWLWKGAKTRGYGVVWANGRNQRAHRFFYEMTHGKIPEGMQPDHLCRVRSCVNLKHLEIVTPLENTLRGNGPTAINARKTRCLKGHLLRGRNLRIDALKSGREGRACRMCARLRKRRYDRDAALARMGKD